MDTALFGSELPERGLALARIQEPRLVAEIVPQVLARYGLAVDSHLQEESVTAPNRLHLAAVPASVGE